MAGDSEFQRTASASLPHWIITTGSVANQPQVGELEDEQFYTGAIKIDPDLGAVAAAEGRMDDVGADREAVGVGGGRGFGHLRIGVINVRFARERANRRSAAL